jgi:TPP-dependent pyruvate/acetoin dehydrogenase alpha subunit
MIGSLPITARKGPRSEPVWLRATFFLSMLGREGDPNSGGRNMPEHFSSRLLNYVSMTACTGSQYLAAVGAAKAIENDGTDAIVYVESGEGATSEGEFFEALNWASRESLPVLFCVQNNGFAISTRQHTQTGSSVRCIADGFGVSSAEIDGNILAGCTRTRFGSDRHASEWGSLCYLGWLDGI